MADTASNTHETIQRAVKALHAGDSKLARELFERVVRVSDAEPSAWLGLAFACAQLGDDDGTMAAVDRLLELEPENLRGILFKGDHLDHRGESRAALRYYQDALRLAARATDLPQDVRQGLRRAQQVCERLEGDYQDFLLAQLKKDGFDPETSRGRFRQSLDILLGRSEIFYQQPRRYYFPGLPQNQFYERSEFPWVETLEAATNAIRDELREVMSVSTRFKPYLDSDGEHLNHGDTSLVDNVDWGAYYLWHYGELMPEAERLCPTTIAALADAPQPQIPEQAPFALFSKLRPQTRIPPHHGLINTRLICHLPLIVPENCGALRVGSERRPWVEGEMLIFDDSIEHEAWNDSDCERVVLLFEIWRPELSDEERKMVSAVLAAVGSYFDS